MTLEQLWRILVAGGVVSDLFWAVIWMLVGAALALLCWSPKIRRVNRLEREVNSGLARLEEWRESARRQFKELSQREKALRLAEEDLKGKGVQIAAQIEQIRGWMERVVQGEPPASGKEPVSPGAPDGAS